MPKKEREEQVRKYLCMVGLKNLETAARDSLSGGMHQRVGLNTPVSEIIPLAVETPYPIAVLDEDNMLQGLVTKASVLSTMA